MRLQERTRRKLIEVLSQTGVLLKNCGIGPDGFTQNNTCARGGKLTESDLDLLDQWINSDIDSGGKSFAQLRDPKTANGAMMTEVLSKLPESNVTLYRGLALSQGDLDLLRSSKTLSLNFHSSSSKDFDVARSFVASATAANPGLHPVLMAITGRGADMKDVQKLLSKDFDEKEVVLKAGSKYRLTYADKRKEYTILTYEESNEQ